MPIKFQHEGRTWELREGGPPMGCRERDDPPFEVALKSAHGDLAEMTRRQLASWIVARLSAITSGTLELEGNSFSHDTNDFGYKIKLSDPSKTTLAYGAVVFLVDRTYFAWASDREVDLQALFVALLVESPNELGRCEIVVRASETKRKRSYGWDGENLITW